MSVQALFMRSASCAPQIRHSLTRYGSREYSAFSGRELSVMICTETSCGVSRPQCSQCSAIPSNVPSVTDITQVQRSDDSIKTPFRSAPFRPFLDRRLAIFQFERQRIGKTVQERF